jgi:hypothetical protein
MFKSLSTLTLKASGFLLLLAVPLLLGHGDDSIYANHDSHDKSADDSAQAVTVQPRSTDLNLQQKALPDKTLTVMLATAKDLSAKGQFENAIAIMRGIPADHRSHPKVINTKNELSQQFLKAAHLSHKQGKVERAIALLKMIPKGTTAHTAAQSALVNWRKF